MAVLLLESGGEVGLTGYTAKHAERLRRDYRQHGLTAFEDKRKNNRDRVLSRTERERVVAVLQTKQPCDAMLGCDDEHWSTYWLGRYIHEAFGKQYKSKTSHYLLFREAKLSFHLPGKRYEKADEVKTAAWVKQQSDGRSRLMRAWKDEHTIVPVSYTHLDVYKRQIMYNTFCSRTVAETITASGGTPFMWRTGHSFLKKKNQEVKAAFIGELSGHFFFSKDFYNHDDGLYSTMSLISYLSRSGSTLSQLVAALPHYVSSPEIKLGCADDKKVALVQKLSPVLRQDFPGATVIDDERAGDGVRLETADDMFVVRYSQNGPYLGVKFESRTPEGYEKLRQYLYDLLHTFPEIDWDAKIQANTAALAEPSV